MADCWPTPAQSLLLKAGLREGPARREALLRLEATIVADALPPGVERLLPLVFRATREREPSALARHAEAAYLLSWQRAERARPQAARALRALRAVAMPVVVLKGWALLDAYGDPALRPSSDLDLLVPASGFAEAARALEAAGWAPLAASAGHAQAFTSPRLDVDLHRHALEEFVGTGHDAALWAGALPATIAGEPALVLDVVDQFLVACVHGLRWNPSPPVHWIADAVLLLRAAAAAFDWDRLVARAQALGLEAPLQAGLRYLAAELAVEIPVAAFDRLGAAAVPWARRVAFAARQLAPERRGLLQAWAVRHELTTRETARSGRAAKRPLRSMAGAWRALGVSLGRLRGRL